MLETNKKQILYSQEGSDDLLLIEDELESVQPEDNWKVLVVDDEVEIHNVTQLALKNFTFERKPLCLISAYSTEQAKQLIQSHPDIALVLLDVVMEKDNSGLDVVNYIRSSLKNDSVQIILRTGQPGKCPENRVIFNYAINDYKTKTELTKSKLVTALVTALRTYGAMTKLDSSKAQMEKRAEESKKLYQKSKNYSQILESKVEERTQELKAKEVRLAVSVAALRAAQKLAKLGNFEYDFVTQDLTWSDELFRILGLDSRRVEPSFNIIQTLIHPDERELWSNSLEAAIAFGRDDEFELRIVRFDGSIRYVVVKVQAFEDGEGKALKLVGTIQDISDRKQAELEITTAKAALEQQIQRVLLQEKITHEIRSSLKPEQVFQTAATQIGQALGVSRCLIHTYIEHPIPQIPIVAEYKQPELESLLNAEVSVLSNPHAELMLAQDQAIASDDACADPLLASASSMCRQLGLKSMLVVRTSYQENPNGAVCLHQCDRHRHWTKEEIELLEAVAAQLGIAIAQANLLQQEKQQRQKLALQNQALEKAKQEAESANRAKSQFLSKMSHELRTPLNAILGFTQMMARDNSLSTEQLDYIGIINRSGEHLLELINDILSMSKIEAGQVTLNRHRFNLHRLLDSLEEMLRLKALSKDIKLVFERTSDVPQYVETDESKLRQVLINLLGNAIKFMHKGSISLRVGMGERERGRVGDGEDGKNNTPLPPSLAYPLLFEVEDTGPGIAPNELSTLFDPFVQTETGRQSVEGTGLGLPISQQFVRLMGGDITVRSTLGQGTVFRFDIPVVLGTAADEKPMPSKQRVIGLEPNQPSYRILVAEDAAVNRKLLVKILDRIGFEVCTACNGQEAVAVWESWSPHLIWMDIIMPVMDGHEAIQQIKRTLKGQNTVIIALTAHAFEEEREAILNAGCNDFVSKPFREEELLEKMALHLGVRYVYEQQPLSASSQLPSCQA